MAHDKPHVILRKKVRPRPTGTFRFRSGLAQIVCHGPPLLCHGRSHEIHRRPRSTVDPVVTVDPSRPRSTVDPQSTPPVTVDPGRPSTPLLPSTPVDPGRPSTPSRPRPLPSTPLLPSTPSRPQSTPVDRRPFNRLRVARVFLTPSSRAQRETLCHSETHARYHKKPNVRLRRVC